MSKDPVATIPSILCEYVENGLRMIRQELATDPIGAGADASPSSRAVVHVVRADQLGAVRALGDRVVDCGKKNPAKPLSAILLGRNNIPVLDGGFKNSGQLMRSLRTLLVNAADADDRNQFIIGVAGALFEQLCALVQPDELRPTSSDAARGDQPMSFQSLLDILPQRKVPEELENMLLGNSFHIRFLRQLVLQAAQYNGPILILGDTGTGKDVVARAIHACSDRRSRLFVPVNCGAISRDLFESELFGHKKGAFTGASADKDGLWKAADQGTLFLDEVGDLTLEHQAKILRALDTNCIRPVGANAELKVNARVIAATNRDLSAMMENGQFRSDLYYRLRSFLIHTEPLSKHPEDIPVLARHFWREITHDSNATLSDELIAILQANLWIGNVRDLKWTLVSLFRYTSLINPGPKHLRTVVWYENQRKEQKGLPQEKRGIDAHRVECLMHLRQTDDALRACEVALRPLIEGKRPNHAALKRLEAVLRRYFEELEVLCLHRLLFVDKDAFKAVEQFKCGVGDLLHVLQVHPGKARAFWDETLSVLLQQASQAVFQEVDRLVKEK